MHLIPKLIYLTVAITNLLMIVVVVVYLTVAIRLISLNAISIVELVLLNVLFKVVSLLVNGSSSWRYGLKLKLFSSTFLYELSTHFPFLL